MPYIMQLILVCDYSKHRASTAFALYWKQWKVGQTAVAEKKSACSQDPVMEFLWVTAGQIVALQCLPVEYTCPARTIVRCST